MANIQHKDIPNADLHEPKGISSAANFQTYVANGAGTGVWTNVPRLVKFTVTYDASPFNLGSVSEQDVNVPGVLTTDTIISITVPNGAFTGLGSGVFISGGQVVSNDNIKIRFLGLGSGAQADPGSIVYTVIVYRP